MAIELRRAAEDDLPAVLELLQTSLGWLPDARHEAFFHWKHHDNPYGASPSWVAVDGDRVVGFRTFLRWELARGSEVVRAVRAVDTATHPDARGQGLFKRLTLHAVDEMRAEGVAFVFNTPNDQSMPGYVRMGWRSLGRPSLRVRPRSPGAVLRLARARVPAELWSVPTDVGDPASEVLAATAELDEMLAGLPSPPPGTLRTNRTAAALRWRYGFEPLAYRAVTSGEGVRGGVVVFRLRRRDSALEAAIVESLVPAPARTRMRRAVAAALRAAGSDYGVDVRHGPAPLAGMVPLPGRGPRVTWRALAETEPPTLGSLQLGLGDLELL